jgi:hypothetical protein
MAEPGVWNDPSPDAGASSLAALIARVRVGAVMVVMMIFDECQVCLISYGAVLLLKVQSGFINSRMEHLYKGGGKSGVL